MSKFLANVFLLCLLFFAQIGVSIYGWGLTPKSWTWIVMVGFFGNLAVLCCSQIMNKE